MTERIKQLRSDYIALHEEVMRHINAPNRHGGAAYLNDLQTREIAIDRELRSLGTSLSEVMATP